MMLYYLNVQFQGQRVKVPYLKSEDCTDGEEHYI